jgi:hypothetical protein
MLIRLVDVYMFYLDASTHRDYANEIAKRASATPYISHTP